MVHHPWRTSLGDLEDGAETIATEIHKVIMIKYMELHPILLAKFIVIVNDSDISDVVMLMLVKALMACLMLA